MSWLELNLSVSTGWGPGRWWVTRTRTPGSPLMICLQRISCPYYKSPEKEKKNCIVWVYVNYLKFLFCEKPSPYFPNWTGERLCLLATLRFPVRCWIINAINIQSPFFSLPPIPPRQGGGTGCNTGVEVERVKESKRAILARRVEVFKTALEMSGGGGAWGIAIRLENQKYAWYPLSFFPLSNRISLQVQLNFTSQLAPFPEFFGALVIFCGPMSPWWNPAQAGHCPIWMIFQFPL